MENIVITAILKAKPGHEAELYEAMKRVVPFSQSEQGCITYKLHQSADDPAVYVFYEIWQDEQSLQKHLASDHYRAYREQADQLAASREVYRLRMVTV
ncbi:putative quinol monooxygenase [Paenibacillus sp. GCM10023252]|uniref:putative quinol monooxygenase n=1 Tax=Paenibacillus sp. GCM10023252 TaxID=3252649 RepID=UPI003608B341